MTCDRDRRRGARLIGLARRVATRGGAARTATLVVLGLFFVAAEVSEAVFVSDAVDARVRPLFALSVVFLLAQAVLQLDAFMTAVRMGQEDARPYG